MIIKQRSIPLRLRKLESLTRRLHPHHAKLSLINDNYRRLKAGFSGEQSLDFYLGLLPQTNYLILHDLRLFDGQRFFQIDTLILTSSFFLIIEVKNISGVITLDQEVHQLIRGNENKEEVFPDPVIQAERQKEQLENFLLEYFSIAVPVEFLVAFTHQKVMIKFKNEESHPALLRAEGIPKRVQSMKMSYHKEVIDQDRLYQLSSRLIEKHLEPKADLFQQFELKRSEIRTGIQCPGCDKYAMIRIKGKWRCPLCNMVSTNAHAAALQDYKYLIDERISNQEARRFLHLDSPVVTNRLLNKLTSDKTGVNRWRRYVLPETH